jgi:hypothetical protein
VQLVPDFHYNALLGQVFEAKVGEGRLLVTSYDLTTDLAKRPAARQFRNSLLRYLQTEAFNLATNFTEPQLRALFNR